MRKRILSLLLALVMTLALAAPVLAHRVILRGMHHQLTGEAFIRSLLDQIPVPTEERA